MKMLNFHTNSEIIKEKVFLFAFLFFFMIMLSPSNAQSIEKNNFADSLSSLLQKKLLLSDSQKSDIKQILMDYLKQPMDETSAKQLNNKILNILNKRQKDKFNIIKNEWWQTVHKKKAKSTQNN